MQVEHLTLGGTAKIRDTADILPTTRRALDAIRLSYENKFVTIPKLGFKIKITATDEGAAFDLMRGEDTAVTNFCCFEEQHSQPVLSNIEKLAEMYNSFGWKVKVIEPVAPQWLYSAVVNPLGFSKEDMMLAGEVELYIFEQLYLAKNDREAT